MLEGSLKQLIQQLSHLNSLTILAGSAMRELSDCASAFPPSLQVLSWVFLADDLHLPSLVHLLGQWNSASLRQLRLADTMSKRTIADETLDMLLQTITPASGRELHILAVHRTHWDLEAMAADLLGISNKIESLEITWPVNQREDDAKTAKILSAMISRLPHLSRLALSWASMLTVRDSTLRVLTMFSTDDAIAADSDDHYMEVLLAAQKVERLELSGQRIAARLLQSIPSTVTDLTIAEVHLSTGVAGIPGSDSMWKMIDFTRFLTSGRRNLRTLRFRPDCSSVDSLVQLIHENVAVGTGRDLEPNDVLCRLQAMLKHVLGRWLAESAAIDRICESQEVRYCSSINTEVGHYVNLAQGVSREDVVNEALRQLADICGLQEDAFL